MARRKAKKKDKPARVSAKKGPKQISASTQQHATGGAIPWKYLAPALLLGLIVFAQTAGFDFVNWDDDLNVLENRGVTQFELKQIWTETVIGNYNPLPITTFAIEHALVGLDASLYHITNVALHLINVVFVFLLGRRLRLDALAAGLLAVLFAIHPLRVESVAWVTERKDVLFAAFYFGALLLYEKRRQQGISGNWHLGIAALFALALVSKIQAVSLPLSMLCLDYLRQRELKLGDILAKAPYFAMSLAVGLAGIYFLGADGSLEDATTYTFLDRLAVGAYAFSVYLVKAVLPYEMSPLYPYPARLPWEAYASFGVVLAVLGFLWVGYQRKWSAAVFGLGFFAVNVVFLLQVLGAGQGFLADRFTYVGYFGLFWLMAYGAQRLLASRAGNTRPAVLAGLGIYILVLSLIAFQQTKIWANGGTLWAHVAAIYPSAATAWGNHGLYERDLGNVAEAERLLTRAIEVSPKRGAYLNSRGKLYFDRGDTELAIADYTEGIRREPDLTELYNNRGAAYAKTGRYSEAEADLALSLEREPDNWNGLLNRSLLLYTQGNLQAAVLDYNKLLEQRPERHDLWQERGSIRAALGEVAEGKADLDEAIRRANTREQEVRYAEIKASL